HRGAGPLHLFPRRRARRRDRLVEAALHRAPDADDGGRHRHARLQPALHRARRCHRRRRHRRAGMVEVAGAADLDRRAGDDGWRHGVAARPAPARRRAGAASAKTGAGGRGGPGRMRRIVAAALLLFSLCAPSLAVQPSEMLDDPVLGERARNLSAGLSGMVCQNQSIDDSDAELARDLRVLVRERISAGESDEAVTDYVVSRYGEFVLLQPRFSIRNALLWATPALL